MKNPRVSKRKEIIKIRAEINAKETTQTIAKINKAKCWFFEKIKKKKWQTISQTNQRIIRDYYQQLYANKMDNLEEMDKFLEKYNFPKLKK